ncbi:MAG: LacI family DNA-binding transcriptional regulator [bacterium]
MSVKLEDIAKKANVSVATVSLALNNKKGVSQKKKEQICDIAQDMGYSVKRKNENKAEKNIRFIIYKRHGNVVTDTPFFARLIEGIQKKSREKNYDLSISHITYSEKNKKNIIDNIANNKHEGLLLLATEMLKEDLKYFSNIKAPLVLVDSYFKNENYDFVLIDNFDGAYKATQYLIDNCHQEIGYLHSSVYINNFRDRKRGWVEALEDNNLSVKEKYIYRIKSTLNGAYRDMKNILNKSSVELPSAFFADNDIIALGAIKALKENNINVPEDISIIGFDDMPFCEISDPPLTTVRVYKEKFGELGLKRLIEKMEGADKIKQKIQIKTELIIRESVTQRKKI